MTFQRKIIHQTWKDENIPDKWKNSKESWIKYHPDWQYKLWTDKDNEELIRNYFPWFLKTYLNFEYNIQRADAIRYCILYLYGGVYCDLDLEPLNNLDDLFNNSGLYFIFSGNTNYIYTNSLMASSSPRESIFFKMINETMKATPFWCLGKHLEVMYSTGPLMVDRIIKKYNKTINVLPSNVIFSPICAKTGCKSKLTRFKDLGGGSWNSWDSKFYNFIMCNYNTIIIFLLLFIIVYLLNKKYNLYRCSF
jgi:mannosyltransferase OCH1-like enzyme